MGFQIISGLPIWFSILCPLIGAAVAAVLYFRNKTSGFSRSLTIFLAFIRFLAVTVIAFLLLSPLVKTTGSNIEKPTLVIGVDNSASMVASPDSSFLRGKLPEFYEKLKSGLGKAYDLKFYTFGQQVAASENPRFMESRSDIASFITTMNADYYNRNLGAMILLTDGIYNSGENPLYPLRNTMYPVFTITLGDTVINRDLIISQVSHNRYAYKGNSFPIEVKIQALEAARESTQLVVSSDGKEVYNRKINITSSNQVFTIPLFVEAGEPGLKKFIITLDGITDEINTSNNKREIFVEVKEMRQKIAIIAASPHPDLAAIKRALENSNNYEAELSMIENFTGKTEDYSLFILHQLPSNNQSVRLINELIQKKYPILFVLGQQSDLSRINQFKAGIALSGFNKSSNEALPALNKDFPLFIITKQMEEFFATCPPLISPFANYQVSNATYTLAYQKIGQIATKMPLITFGQTAEARYGFIAGEGIWKWRMQNFVDNSNHAVFDDLINKSVQYLSQPGEKGKFRVYWNNYYAEYDPIEFSARLYNEADEPITGPEVKILITNENGKEYSYSFNSNDEVYELNIGTLPAGLYSFRAETDPGTGILTKTGNFVVSPLNLEDINTIADYRLLKVMANETGGTSFRPEEIDNLIELIKNREDIKPVVYSKKRYTDLVDFFPLLIILILLMGVEWFLRKFYGSY
ncbi:MAG: hypothetical protein RBS07_09275 [Lentimicrobium sp.]|nr:hypothetical protein [Lentimicrobium sp.]